MAKLIVVMTYEDDNGKQTTVSETISTNKSIDNLLYYHDKDVELILIDLENELIAESESV